ncbi:hypothetical protein BFINE_09240 [Bacteroides finegoldii DSM 17565]|nr:hypothetical protein BFINE_09240 [Bacteroides finegoldii DSM 17565]
MGTQIYGGIDQSDPTKDRSHVTVMFTVPETAPAELFPLKVYISVGGLDIRPESGMALTVVRDGEKDWYSSGDITPEPDYKYLYIVEHPGYSVFISIIFCLKMRAIRVNSISRRNTSKP